MQHIIKKQAIELTIDKHLDAFDIQQQVTRLGTGISFCRCLKLN